MKKRSVALVILAGLIVFSISLVFSFSLSFISSVNCANQDCDNTPANGIVDSGKSCSGTFGTWYYNEYYNINLHPLTFTNGWAWVEGDGEWIYNSGNGWYWAQGNCVSGTYPRYLFINMSSGWTWGTLNCSQRGIPYCSGSPSIPDPSCSPLELVGGDHCGYDWVISSNTEIAGTHYNIKNFIVAPSVIVKVKPFNGNQYGSVEIYAKNITISGTLNASAVGYGGGGGGGGGASDTGESGEIGGVGGNGVSGGYKGANGYNSQAGWARGGEGGVGGGIYGGINGKGAFVSGAGGSNHGVDGDSGANGGYSGVGINGDGSTDESILMGSGGGGAGGGSGAAAAHNKNTGAGGAGGGSGARGGGYIKLYATSNLNVFGNILSAGGSSGGDGVNGASVCNICDAGAFGSVGGDASGVGTLKGGKGGNFGCYGTSWTSSSCDPYPTNTNYFGGAGGDGGFGAGGGVLLQGYRINIPGTIDNRGGGNNNVNGGTVKIFCGTGAKSVTGNIRTGRYYSSSICTITTPVPQCTSADWSSSLSPLPCPSSSQQTKTWTKISSVCQGGFNPLNPETISCLRPCTSADWSSSLSPSICPSTQQQTRSWSQIGQCDNSISGAVNHPATETISCVYTAPTCTSFTYSDWSECSSSGTQSRQILSSLPSNCQGGSPVISQSCTYLPSCSASDWSSSLSPSICPSTQQQTRTWTRTGNCNQTRAGAVNHPATETASCVYTAPTCTSFTYSDWSECSSSGTQSRQILSSSPDGCLGGNPSISQSCNYIPPCTSADWSSSLSPSICPSTQQQTRSWSQIGQCDNSISGAVNHPATETISCVYTAPTCTSFTYSDWGECSSSGTQSRQILSSSPSNCQGGSPIISQSCTYLPSCSASDWSSSLSPLPCPSTQQQTRAWTRTGNCNQTRAGAVNHPATETISCVYTAPTCTSFTYSDWGECSSSGTQSRQILTSSPSNCQGGSPIISQSCNYIPPCTDADWSSSLSPLTCPSTQQQTKSWNKIGLCSGGVSHPATETVSCVYTAPTCTSFTYSDWSECSSSNSQSRQILSSLPNGCSGGNPSISQSCTYLPSCIASDWTYSLLPLDCPLSETQTITWTLTGNCNNTRAGAITHPATEPTTCDYTAPTCTSFTYSSWSECSSSGTQSCQVLTSLPDGCQGGSPLISQECIYIPPCTQNCAPESIILGEFVCTGNINGNAQLCSGDNVGLTEDTPKILVDSCSSENKCEYFCNPTDYLKIGSSCIRKFLDIPYWTDTNGNPINQTYLGNTVLMISNLTGLEGQSINYTIKQGPNVLLQIFGWVILQTYTTILGTNAPSWEANVSFDDIYFKVNIGELEATSGNFNVSIAPQIILPPPPCTENCDGGQSGSPGNAGNVAPRAVIENPIINPAVWTTSGIPVQFVQNSYDPDGNDDLSITWDFGDGFSTNYTGCNAVNICPASETHIYSNPGVYNVVLTVEEERQNNPLRASAYSTVYVVQEGINVVPVITSPANGIAYGNLVSFDASDSYVTNCSNGEMSNIDFVPEGGFLNCSYISAPITTNLYDFILHWTVTDENGNLEFAKTGNWSTEYNSTVQFQKYFTRFAMHNASLSMTYLEK